MFLITYGFGWLWSIFSSFWFWLDSTILNFISYLYDLLLLISRTSILSQGDIKEFADRIQMLLGIFMLFKVGFSLVMYIVNPEDFSDGSKGVGKLAGNTVIALLVLILTPYIFNMAFRLQSLILEDNTLGRLILGDEDADDYMQTAGDLMAFQVMLPFFQPNTGISELTPCIDLYDIDGEGKTVFNKNCYQALKRTSNVVDKKGDNGQAGQVIIDNYKNGVEKSSLGLTFRLDTINYSYEATDGDDIYVFEYRWPLTTIVGIVVCLLLVTFCIDIAIRSVKLSFLQLIAPIPILTIMDPKGTKDGLFSKWYKLCFTTYLSLFVRLMALFFGIYIISKVGTLYDNVNGSTISDGMVKIFIIIGVLFFVKQLPKILENLGFKLDGGFQLNPLKKMEEGMAGFGAAKRLTRATGAAALAGAGVMGANALAAAKNVKNAEGAKNKFKALGKGFGSVGAGGFSGLWRGAKGGLSKDGTFKKARADAYKKAIDNKKTRADRKEDDVSFYEPWVERFKNTTGLETESARNEKDVKAAEGRQKHADTIRKTRDELERLADAKGKDVKVAKKKLDYWEGVDASSLVGTKYKDTDGKFKDIKNLEQAIDYLQKQQKSANDALDSERSAFIKNSIDDKDSEVLGVIEKANTSIEALNAGIENESDRMQSFSGNTVWEQSAKDEGIYKTATKIYVAADSEIAAKTVGDAAKHASNVAQYAKGKDN